MCGGVGCDYVVFQLPDWLLLLRFVVQRAALFQRVEAVVRRLEEERALSATFGHDIWVAVFSYSFILDLLLLARFIFRAAQIRFYDRKQRSRRLSIEIAVNHSLIFGIRPLALGVRVTIIVVLVQRLLYRFHVVLIPHGPTLIFVHLLLLERILVILSPAIIMQFILDGPPQVDLVRKVVFHLNHIPIFNVGCFQLGSVIVMTSIPLVLELVVWRGS